jgi:ABC-type lipoprotein export system ATPase subunit
MMKYKPIFVLNEITKQVKDGKEYKAILENISFEINSGEFVGISGDSGAGKSTLLHIMGGLDTISDGQIIFDGQNISSLNSRKMAHLRRQIGFVFQASHLIDHLSVLENVLIPLKISGKNHKNVRQKAIALLEEFGIIDSTSQSKLNQLPRTLSGGEKQRVAIARAVLANPQVILADEPTGSLDFQNEQSVMDLLHRINTHYKTTVVLISHNQRMIEKCSRVIHLRNGKVSI